MWPRCKPSRSQSFKAKLSEHKLKQQLPELLELPPPPAPVPPLDDDADDWRKEALEDDIVWVDDDFKDFFCLEDSCDINADLTSSGNDAHASSTEDGNCSDFSFADGTL